MVEKFKAKIPHYDRPKLELRSVIVTFCTQKKAYVLPLSGVTGIIVERAPFLKSYWSCTSSDPQARLIHSKSLTRCFPKVKKLEIRKKANKQIVIKRNTDLMQKGNIFHEFVRA